MAAGFGLLLAGCASQQPVPVQVESLGDGVVQQLRGGGAWGADPAAPASSGLALVAARSSTDPMSEAVAQMAQQLSAGLRENRIRRLPMAVLPFADLDRAAVPATNPVGERIAENFIYQLQQAQYNLVDFRAVSLNTTEKPPLSRQSLSLLNSHYRIYFVLTGTYARYPDGVVLNARVLDTTTRQVLASAQTHVPGGRLEGALPGYDPLTSRERGMIIENRNGEVAP
ncbi:hypothetical protein GCM10011348_11600 [Marinobacterium nitratireducens]|uniref:FlgO domain-containing protein n=1 Tax=Marinobacterium nitratireducens TaxID=518897 RepID=A0A918DPT7_9GAMM|nr:hypothetical protein GCM10011348_11600 [Marinobacterium nitratireducens]